ncbi:MAG: amino acid adenylation domain-containing protein [Flavobacteriaceae bacterium]
MEIQGNKESLLSHWKNRSKKENLEKAISPAPADAIIPLSHGQQQLWFLQQLYPNNPFYNYSESYVLKGLLQVEHLLKGLQMIYRAHDILGSTYHIEDGRAIQRIGTHNDLIILKHDLSRSNKSEAREKAQKIMLEEATRSFDLTKGPLMNASLIKLDATEHILQITLHHIVTDKWSMGILRQQLAKYYTDLCSNLSIVENKTEIQYADYAYWQHKREIDTKQLSYWKDKLSGEIPLLDIPTDYTRPIHPSFKGAFHVQNFSKELSSGILSLSKTLNTTPYVLLLSVYYNLLYRYSGQKDILVGSPISNRDQKVLEDLIGFFNDTVVLRTKLSPTMSFVDLVTEVRKTTLEAFSNKNVPFDLLVKTLKPERSLHINPFFQVMFLYHLVPPTPNFGSNLELSHSAFDSGVSKFDLTMYISEDNGLLSATFEYATDLFQESTIKRFQEYFKLLLQGVLENPKQSISEIPMLTQAEEALIFASGSLRKQPFDKYKGIHQIIEEVGKDNPDGIALVLQDTSMSYEQLNGRAELLAKVLLNRTNKKNEVVGLCLERSLDMIVGILAILKAGCAYLPIDPEYPVQRIQFILKDADVDLILTQKSLASIFEEFGSNTIKIDCEETFLNNSEKSLPSVRDEDIAYVMYTSGSTGQPKGVPITHKNIINSTQGRLEFYTENPTSFLLMSSIAFDSSMAGIFWTLCTGGTLIISENRIEQDISRIGDTIKKNKVSHTLMLPTLYKLVLEHSAIDNLESLTTVIVAGEECKVSMCKEHFKTLPKVKLYNEYGPTEATVWCIAHQIKEKDLSNHIPIGKSVANAKIYLLNQELQPVPFGAVGEIYIGGPGLAEKYLNRPELTDAVFINDPFKEKTRGKLYKTGDLGKFREDGIIDFLGRADQQVKIRGYRIELDEIEKIILDNAMVDKAVIVVEELERDNQMDATAIPEAYELMMLLDYYLREQEVDELLNSIDSLNKDQKEYLLQQIS